MISNIYASFGPQFAWGLEFLVLGANLLTWVPLYQRMVPLCYEKNLSLVKIHSIEESKNVSPFKSDGITDAPPSQKTNDDTTLHKKI